MDMETVHRVALWGFFGAMVFGIVANKTHFCTMGSISDWINIGIKNRFRTWMLAMGIALIGTQVMAALGWIDLRQSIYLSTSVGWAGYIVGGLIFGIGMTIGSGCGQRTLVRLGAGNLKSLVVFLVMGITAYMTLRGLLAYVRIELMEFSSTDLSLYDLPDQSIASILGMWAGIDPNTILTGLTAAIGLATIYFAFKDASYRNDSDNILAAVTVGVLVAGAWYATGVIGNDEFEPLPLESLSFIGPSGNMINYLMTFTGATINFGIAVIFGVIAGSFIYAIVTRTFRFETFASRSDFINHLLAGVLMGFGGVLALGCTIGQGVAGMSTLAVGSIIALLSIILGSALTIKMQYYLLDGGFGQAFYQTLADFHVLPKTK
ncbi:MAG: YeeE/YedE family protein [Gammaproteobacteria bacterium]|nr:YeeE/YedE family protein [Gammaproteobacteria bacterium]MDH3467143.1 YeeE/YedE family protein [Gammaproteobacteria bacterium]